MFTDIMVDLETTGTNPAYNQILQLAAVKFNLETREVGTDLFDRALLPAPNRFWQEDTRDFWSKLPTVYSSIVQRAEDPKEVLVDFYDWVAKDQPDIEGGYRFWAKPITFDWNFVASYYAQYGLPLPFHYRYARDVNSYAAGLRGAPAHVSLDNIVSDFTGVEHNAKWDCLYQIEVLFHVQDEHDGRNKERT
jgi:DNA polymerase III epsilon subunit-like protein